MESRDWSSDVCSSDLRKFAAVKCRASPRFLQVLGAPLAGPCEKSQFKLSMQPSIAFGWQFWTIQNLAVNYAHCLPNASRLERPRSSGVIATRNSTFALKVRNQGSARAGMPEGSSRLTTRVPPRGQLCSQKYTASGLAASRIRLIFCPTDPSRTAVLNGSSGK